MQLTTTASADAVWAEVSRRFTGDTAVCNWILSAVTRNAAADRDGFRYWLVEQNETVTAMALLSVGSGRLDLTPMDGIVAGSLAEHVAEDVDSLIGVLGPAAAAATFAGRWTELANVGARPTDGGRVLEVQKLISPPSPPGGRVRSATADDLELLVSWNAGFAADTDVPAPPDPSAHLREHTEAGSVWVWEGASGPQAMGMRTASVMKTRRIAHVYTPPEQRERGIAAALVAHLAAETLAAGDRCMLHTQLSNPSSNGVYRRLGFEAISESTFYEFVT